jgi:hypothetical protein
MVHGRMSSLLTAFHESIEESEINEPNFANE